MSEPSLNQIRQRLYADGCMDFSRNGVFAMVASAGKSYAADIQPWRESYPICSTAARPAIVKAKPRIGQEGVTSMLDWVSIRDPIARAAAKAAYCASGPLPTPVVRRVVIGPKQGHYVSDSGYIHHYGGAAGRRVAEMVAAPTASRSPIRWFRLSVTDNWCGSANMASPPST